MYNKKPRIGSWAILLPFYTFNNLENQNFEQNENHLTQVMCPKNHDHDVWFLRYKARLSTVSSRVETPPPLFWGNPSFWSKFEKLPTPPLSESHPNWCMQIVWKTLTWRSYISYYTKSIENIVIITLYIFRLNSVFTTDSLVRYCL